MKDEEDSKASDCIGQMRDLDKCMSQYPDLYGRSASRQKYDELQADESGAMLGISASMDSLDVKNGDEVKNDRVERTDQESKDNKSL